MHIRQLSPELQEKAEKELNEVPSQVKDDLKYLREWLKKQPHIKARTEDQWLLAFLRGCKFSLEKTKVKLDTFYTMRTLVPEFFANRDPFLPEIQEILSNGTFWVPLPKTADPAAPRIVIFGNSNMDPNRISVFNAMKVNLMVLDILLNEDDNSSVAGNITLQDLKGMQMGYVFQMTPSFFTKSVTCLHKAYPIRSRAQLFINAPSITETVFNVVKGILSDKMKKRINIRSDGDCSNIHSDVPLSILPKDFGGDGGSLEELIAEWKKKVESYSDWFKKDAKYGTDEKKRPGKPKTTGDIFGVEGSFRKLNID